MASKNKNVPKKVAKALDELIEYSWSVEMDDAYESRENGESLEGHVFELLVTVDNWLHGRTMTMDDYIDDRYGESDEQ